MSLAMIKILSSITRLSPVERINTTLNDNVSSISTESSVLLFTVMVMKSSIRFGSSLKNLRNFFCTNSKVNTASRIVLKNSAPILATLNISIPSNRT